MKLLLYTDMHITESKSSLTSKIYNKYSRRLDSCVSTLNWIYSQAEVHDVDAIFQLGDLFDRPNLSAQEISSLVDGVSFNTQCIPEYHLIGNHEIAPSYHDPLSLLKLAPNCKVIYSDTYLPEFNVLALPYTTSYSYLTDMIVKELSSNPELVIVSHNDYKGRGLNYNGIEVTSGIDLDQVPTDSLIFNGHNHNALSLGGYHQVGSVIGSSFNDNYGEGLPGVIILDTSSREWSRISNPYAPRFYTFRVNSTSELESQLLEVHGSSLGTGGLCIRIYCPASISEDIRGFLDESTYDIISSSIVAQLNEDTQDQVRDKVSISTSEDDIISELVSFCKNNSRGISTEDISNFISKYNLGGTNVY